MGAWLLLAGGWREARGQEKGLVFADRRGITNCVTSTTVLDVVAQNTPKDELVIAIARPGDGETRGELNRRRLHNVKHYLTTYLTHPDVRRKPETVVLAEGDRTKGYGRVEFYVAGKLFDYLKVRPGGDLIVGTCYPDDPKKITCTLESDKDFYPCRDLNPPRSRRRRRS